jgi:uncharacterized protein YcbX
MVSPGDEHGKGKRVTLLGHVAELWRYPVSSAGGERLAEAHLESGGVRGDRLWGVVADDGGEIAAPEKIKRWRPLPNVAARYDGGAPQIRVGDGAWLPVDQPEASAAIGRFMEFPVSLRPHVPFGVESPKGVAPRYQRANIHLLTTASMRTLAGHVPDAAEIVPRRFRPNMVIETEPDLEGFAESNWIGRRLAIGGAVISITEACARCTFTALAQGELRFEPAVLQNIARHGGGGFGVLCAIERVAPVTIGDRVELLDS